MKKFLKSGVIGVVAGAVNGLFGSGGGNIIVPATEKWLGVKTHAAHATAVAAILPLSVVSGYVYAGGVEIDWVRLSLVSAGGIAGGIIGALLLRKFSARWLHIVFGLFMVAAAAGMILR
ncbi:MAG: TSUP family transporter [Clostridiales bacterium]|jgi:uncharacterized membrane protein YfcA|nr:TSUP family transporter [Clostridiales bacterium]